MLSHSVRLFCLAVRIVEGLKNNEKILASFQQLKHLHKLVKLLRERIVCPGNASFSKLSCKESRCLTSCNLGDSGEIASAEHLSKLMESFCFLAFSVFILSKLFPLGADGSA